MSEFGDSVLIALDGAADDEGWASSEKVLEQLGDPMFELVSPVNAVATSLAAARARGLVESRWDSVSQSSRWGLTENGGEYVASLDGEGV